MVATHEGRVTNEDERARNQPGGADRGSGDPGGRRRPERPVGFRPGEVWADTDGQPINAHGGGVLFHGGTYYRYGEIKTGRTWAPESNKGWGGTRVEMKRLDRWSQSDLPDSRYVWLPLRFEDEGFRVEWRDVWSLDDF
jgi:hypothetical protein